MSTSSFIRRHIFSLPVGVIFSTRDLLIYGSRAAVDQCLYRLVKAGVIIRLAWGIFVLWGPNIPSLAEIAAAKAKAFGKQIHKLENRMNFFATSGRTSVFRIGQVTTKLKGVSPRKMSLAANETGQIALELWELGKQACTEAVIGKSFQNFLRSQKIFMWQSKSLIPAWFSDRWVGNKVNPYGPALLAPGFINFSRTAKARRKTRSNTVTRYR